MFYERPPMVNRLLQGKPENLHQVKSSTHSQDLLSKDLECVSLLYFWAPWAESCKQMTDVITVLARKYPKLLSLQIEAKEQSEIAELLDIESVPSFVILKVRPFLPLFTSLWVPSFHPDAGPYTSQPHLGRRRRCPHQGSYETCEPGWHCPTTAFPD
jgi:thiol-disulfide isomerase/thioredoxin